MQWGNRTLVEHQQCTTQPPMHCTHVIQGDWSAASQTVQKCDESELAPFLEPFGINIPRYFPKLRNF